MPGLAYFLDRQTSYFGRPKDQGEFKEKKHKGVSHGHHQKVATATFSNFLSAEVVSLTNNPPISPLNQILISCSFQFDSGFFWLGNLSFILFSHFLAQTNSVARMANPRGMTNIAGPGNTIMATPINSTVNPIIAMMILLTCRMVFSIKYLRFFRCRSYGPRWFNFFSAPFCQGTCIQHLTGLQIVSIGCPHSVFRTKRTPSGEPHTRLQKSLK
jgi:hypothetical protein